MFPFLFSQYFEKLFLKRNHLSLGCRVGLVYTGAFRYADDVALHAPSTSTCIYCLKQMIEVCESFAKLHFIVLNPIEPKLLCLIAIH